mgnify:CR=1 FL=1|jgi:hypothetical protein
MTPRGRLASRSVFAARLWGNGLWALAIVAAALGVGIAGYMFHGNMGLAQAFANAAMILSGMGPLDKLETPAGFVFEGIYALVCGLLFFAVAGLILAPMLHRLLHRFHLEDTSPEAGTGHPRGHSRD